MIAGIDPMNAGLNAGTGWCCRAAGRLVPFELGAARVIYGEGSTFRPAALAGVSIVRSRRRFSAGRRRD